MKLNNILVVIFLILAIFTLSAVSAGDINGTTEELAVSNDIAGEDLNEIDNDSSLFDCNDFDEVLGISDDDVLSACKVNFGEGGVINLDGDKDIEIAFPDNAKVYSYYYFYIDNKLIKKQTIDYKGFSEYLALKNLDCGKHSYKLVYKNNKNVKVTKEGTFKVDWQTFELAHYYGKDGDRTIEDICYGDKYKNSIVLPNDANGNVHVIVNNKTHYYFGVSEFNSMVISDLPIGRNEIVFEYSDDKYNGVKRVKDIVNVYAAVKAPETLSYLQSAVFTLNLPEDANGTLVAHYPNNEVTSKVVNGTAKIELPVLSIGSHRIYVWYNGSDYSVKPFGSISRVNGISVFDEVTFGADVQVPCEMTVGDKEYLRFKLPADANGVLEINYEEVALVNGSASVSLSNLDANEHTFSVTYHDDSKYPDLDHDFTVVVNRKVPIFNITFPDEIIANVGTKFTFSGPGDCEGRIEIYCPDDSYSNDLKKGKTTVKAVAPKKYGKQSLVYLFDSYSDDYSSVRGLINFTSIPTPKIQARDVRVYYNGGTHVYKVRILDGYGKPVGAGEKVRAYGTVDDNAKGKLKKYDKVLKTDKNGYITIKAIYPCLNQYTFVYKGVESNSVCFVVDSITWLFVNGQKLPETVKKSSKKIYVEVHLRNGGDSVKLIAYKKVKVKFNGKTYTAKTNAKGIAKLSIGQKDINKLKVGKKYRMTATYAKDLFSVVADVKFKVVQ